MTRYPAAQLLRTVVIAAIVLWSLAPIGLGVATSLSTQADVQAVPARWLPQHATLDPYRSLLGGTGDARAGGTVAEGGAFAHALWNSASITLMSALTILCVAISAGYAFARLRFPGRGALFWAIVATAVVPVFTVVIALFGLLADAHLLDRKLGLVLVFLSTTTPLAMWLMHNHVKELPAEPEEAALIDGCTRWQAFWHVVLPQLRSGIAALSAIVVLLVWGEFLIPLLLTSTSASKPVTVLIPEYIGKYTTNYPLLAAAGVLALLPPAIVALVLNRHIRGMLSGSS
ncbi:MAG: carbohydrate ABC transporter permease [Pseudonocardiaceae bacterium]